ncbi:serine/threonine protein kinase [Croceifilum oryzae]|uniref:Serine/threonine protein kinase n=1 Tax=Croceifilum oryzae TaxID=1553429 RepID=A0AAJ1TFM9_9BACL|nr:hypothetical protein [Croceifilum oryzae]MDQ0417644.1 serine/threonine protein kinase [Croceifilum oryzae]
MNLIDQVSKCTGLELKEINILPARKGFAAKVEKQGVMMLLKAVELSEERERSLQKEARILQSLSNFTGDLYVAKGKVDGYFWLLRKWLDGKTATKQTIYIRENPTLLGNKRQFIADICQMLEKVVELYDLGYLHGDLQPGHFIFAPDGEMHLIDLELTVDSREPNPIYRGALVHYVPPETAAGMLAGSQEIPLDAVSEIYSFGAVVFYLYTRVVPVAYSHSMEDPSYDFEFNDMLQAVRSGRVRSFAQAGATPFAELEYILQRCLETDRAKRYQSFSELLCMLEEINVMMDEA